LGAGSGGGRVAAPRTRRRPQEARVCVLAGNRASEAFGVENAANGLLGDAGAACYDLHGD